MARHGVLSSCTEHIPVGRMQHNGYILSNHMEDIVMLPD